MKIGLGIGIGYNLGAVSAATAAMLMLAGEDDGLALDFTATSDATGSAAVKDTGTPANDFDGAPQDLLTYAGSSAKWVYNSAGVLVNSPAGTLPIDHDPLTFARKGLLVELQRTRLNTIAAAPSAAENITVTAVAHTLTFFGTGTVTLSGVSTAGPLVGTGASDRVELTFTPTAGTLTLTPSGTVADMQLEAGAFPTSVIKGEGVTVTRAKDDISLLTSAFPYSATAGVAIIKFTPQDLGYPWAISNGTTAERIVVYAHSSSNYRMFMADNNVVQADITIGLGTINTLTKIACTWAVNDLAAVLNGGTVVTDSSATLPTPTKLQLAHAATSNVLMTGHITTFKYLPRRMSNAGMQTETAA